MIARYESVRTGTLGIHPCNEQIDPIDGIIHPVRIRKQWALATVTITVTLRVK